MAHLNPINLKFLVIFFSLVSILVEPSSSLPNNADGTLSYIQASCKNTLYKDLCIQCLSKFSHSPMESPQQLAQVALSYSFSRALYTRAYLLKVANQLKSMKNKRDYLIVQDYCLSQINDSVDQLDQSLKEIRQMSQPATTGTPTVISDKVLLHISNVETWVSTALTEASTCVNSFPGHKMSKLSASVRVKVQNFAQVTSNALALFHGYAAKYRVAALAKATKKP